MELHGFPRRSIAPATPMDSLLPASGRREHWRELSERIGAPLPALSLPGWTGATFRDLGVALLWICLAACFVFPQSTALVCIVGSALLAWAARRTAAPFEVAIPAECATVGDTVRAILRSTQGVTSQTPKVWEPNEVWETLRRIVAEQFDVPLDVVTVTTDFVRDLGAD
jgi:hypothetical protein